MHEPCDNCILFNDAVDCIFIFNYNNNIIYIFRFQYTIYKKIRVQYNLHVLNIECLFCIIFTNYINLFDCCGLPTPMTLASGGSPMFPLVVHQPASPSIWPAVQSHRRGLSTNPGVTLWCVCGCS